MNFAAENAVKFLGQFSFTDLAVSWRAMRLDDKNRYPQYFVWKKIGMKLSRSLTVFGPDLPSIQKLDRSPGGLDAYGKLENILIFLQSKT